MWLKNFEGVFSPSFDRPSMMSVPSAPLLIPILSDPKLLEVLANPPFLMYICPAEKLPMMMLWLALISEPGSSTNTVPPDAPWLFPIER